MVRMFSAALVAAASITLPVTLEASQDPQPRMALSADGTRIAYDVTGSGPAVLLLHGGGQNRKTWQRAGYVDRLSGDFTVVTMDLRGHGESGKPTDPSSYRVDRIVEDVLAVADAAGVQKFALWGFSYGANVGRYVAARSERVTAMIYVGVPFGPAADDDFRKAILDIRATAAERGTSPVTLAWLTALLEYPSLEPSMMRSRTLWLVGTANAGAMASVRKYEGALKGTPVTVHLLEGLTHAQELERIDAVLPVALAFIKEGM